MEGFRAVARQACKVAVQWIFPASCLVATAGPVWSEDDAFQLLREEQFVTAASKRPQPMSETPSIVTVITALEIRSHGYRTLGEALQWVRGLYTRYDRNYTYLGVRGVQRPGDYNNKVLLSIDGHTMNSPIYGDAAFGRELGLDLERVERIEVIRGPGSALYGSNAVLAVVNVVTRVAGSGSDLETGASAGSFGERRAYLSIASARPDRPRLSFTGSWTDIHGADFEPAGNTPGFGPAGRVAGVDGERGVNLLASLAWKETRLTAKFNDRLKHIPTGAYGTRRGDPGTRTNDGHDFVELSTLGQPGPSLEWSGRAYWDGSRYSGDYAYGPDSARWINRDFGTSDLVGAETRLHWRPADHHVTTFGIESRWILRALQSNADVDPYFSYTRSNLRSASASVYLQDELQLFGSTRVTAGGRLDAESKRAGVVSPRLDVHVPLSALTAWKLMAGSAFRSPVPYETHYEFVGQLPNPGLLPERVTTVETSLERRVGAARLGVSVYRSWIRDLIDVAVIDTLGTVMFINRGRIASTGLEGEVQWSARPGLHVRADLARQRSREVDRPINLSNSPYWNGHLVVTQALRASPLRLGLAMRWLGARATTASNSLPSYALIDARLAWAPRAPIEFGVEARNLLDTSYADPGANEHQEDALPQDGRSLYFTIALRRPATP
ncbi:MAG: TonB-dependent receptor [Candidatus Eisenbacteria bacterium]